MAIEPQEESLFKQVNRFLEGQNKREQTIQVTPVQPQKGLPMTRKTIGLVPIADQVNRGYFGYTCPDDVTVEGTDLKVKTGYLRFGIPITLLSVSAHHELQRRHLQRVDDMVYPHDLILSSILVGDGDLIAKYTPENTEFRLMGRGYYEMGFKSALNVMYQGKLMTAVLKGVINLLTSEITVTEECEEGPNFIGYQIRAWRCRLT